MCFFMCFLPIGRRFAYAAPEVILGQPAGLKSDIFSMGVVLHEVRSFPSAGGNPTPLGH